MITNRTRFILYLLLWRNRHNLDSATEAQRQDFLCVSVPLWLKIQLRTGFLLLDFAARHCSSALRLKSSISRRMVNEMRARTIAME